MQLEQKIRGVLLFLAALSASLVALGYFKFKDATLSLWIGAAVIIFTFVLLEIYLRIQHNIDRVFNMNKKINENQELIGKYVDEFKKDSLAFFEKVLDRLDVEKQRMDNSLLSEKSDFEKKMDIITDKFEFTRKETNERVEKISQKSDDILLSLKLFLNMYKISNADNTSKIGGKIIHLENKIRELEKKINNKS